MKKKEKARTIFESARLIHVKMWRLHSNLCCSFLFCFHVFSLNKLALHHLLGFAFLSFNLLTADDNRPRVESIPFLPPPFPPLSVRSHLCRLSVGNVAIIIDSFWTTGPAIVSFFHWVTKKKQNNSWFGLWAWWFVVRNLLLIFCGFFRMNRVPSIFDFHSSIGENSSP